MNGKNAFQRLLCAARDKKLRILLFSLPQPCLIEIFLFRANTTVTFHSFLAPCNTYPMRSEGIKKAPFAFFPSAALKGFKKRNKLPIPRDLLRRVYPFKSKGRLFGTHPYALSPCDKVTKKIAYRIPCYNGDVKEGIRSKRVEEGRKKSKGRCNKFYPFQALSLHRIQPCGDLSGASGIMTKQILKSESEYLCQYWVGLMDGDGSLQVNHWRKKSLQYRLVIKLKNDPLDYNKTLLQKIKQVIGGNVRIVAQKRFVIWVENHRKKISQILTLFNKYPPLTSRLKLQYRFYLESLKRDSVIWYLQNRDKKYTHLSSLSDIMTLKPTPSRDTKGNNITREKEGTCVSDKKKVHELSLRMVYDEQVKLSQDYIEKSYFKGWLSGFIEAEGCFTLRHLTSKNASFSLSQKGEPLLLEKINQFFGGQRKVRKVVQKKNKVVPSDTSLVSSFLSEKDDFYILEIYRKPVLKKVVSHCTAYPLYGSKQKSFNLFKKTFI